MRMFYSVLQTAPFISNVKTNLRTKFQHKRKWNMKHPRELFYVKVFWCFTSFWDSSRILDGGRSFFLLTARYPPSILFLYIHMILDKLWAFFVILLFYGDNIYYLKLFFSIVRFCLFIIYSNLNSFFYYLWFLSKKTDTCIEFDEECITIKIYVPKNEEQRKKRKEKKSVPKQIGCSVIIE